MTDAITGKTVDAHIENPDQASTNFYWSFETVNGVFNLQTTIRGVLTLDQIKAHVKSALEANAHIVFLGGTARGKSDGSPSAILPVPTPVDVIVTEAVNADPVLSQPQSSQASNVFETSKLLVTITNGKKYCKVKGGPWVKYGVTCWDEVLVAAGIPVGKLEGKEYDLAGYKATVILKADGKPEKVIKLEKVS
jgi:hypothetical protein